jgi:predicted small integral membrane protein
MTPPSFDVEGPVRVEVFVVSMAGADLVLTGPDGARPWHIETHGSGHPMDEAREVVERLLPDVSLFHSTSWRWDHEAVVLTFLAVLPAQAIGSMEAVVVPRVGLARSEATRAPSVIESTHVLEHALRHLAWLAKEDDVVRRELDDRWHTMLTGYVPAPFEQLTKETP